MDSEKKYYDSLWEQSKRRVYTTLLTMAIISMAVVFSMLFSSCATKQKIVQEKTESKEVVVDSTNISKTTQDSIDVKHSTDIKEKETKTTDKTVEKSDSTVTVVDTAGNVVKQETWHKEKTTINNNREYEKLLTDSIAFYKAELDSVKIHVAKSDSLMKNHEKYEKEVVEKVKIPKIFWASMVFSILCIIFAIVKFIRWLQIH